MTVSTSHRRQETPREGFDTGSGFVLLRLTGSHTTVVEELRTVPDSAFESHRVAHNAHPSKC